MKLTVREAAKLLDVSEKSVYRWIKEGLPAYRINDQHRINRAELLEWATARKIGVSPAIFEEPESGDPAQPSLSEALRAGGIHYRVGGHDKASVLHAVVDLVKLPDDVDREFFYQVLLAREALGSTGIGDGIAIPHVRNPIVLQLSHPVVTLCFLEHPVHFGALDGQPVHTLFMLISPTVRGHLHLLSRLAFALRQPRFSAAVRNQASREEIFEALQAVDDSLADSRPPAPADAAPEQH